MLNWQLRDRTLEIDRPIVVGILNVTPDSFSDGGQYASLFQTWTSGLRAS